MNKMMMLGLGLIGAGAVAYFLMGKSSAKRPQPKPNYNLNLSTASTITFVDIADSFNIAVNGNPVTGSVDVYINGKKHTVHPDINGTFSLVFTSVGTYNVYAMWNGVKSNVIRINVYELHR